MENKKFKLYYYLSIVFISCILISNVVASRTFELFGFQLPSSTILFPISFIVGDVLTELYGFKNSLKVFLLGFICNIFMVVTFMIINILPIPETLQTAEAFKTVLSYTPRVLIGSLTGFLLGNIVNSSLMILFKKLTKQRFLWIRTILSTIVGEIIDTFCFIFIAFVGILPLKTMLLSVFITSLVKIVYEIMFTPIVYLIIHKNKLKEEK
ncbi:MAG: queuosine precursor transporter [Clostridia bacterium]|nr:queuosine precursor transporter [Clostridia bacterium]